MTEFDVVIIGGGLSGSSTALNLSKIGMSLLMTLIITYINTGMDKDYINRFLKAWVVSLPIAIIAALILGPPIKKLVDKITK